MMKSATATNITTRESIIMKSATATSITMGESIIITLTMCLSAGVRKR